MKCVEKKRRGSALFEGEDGHGAALVFGHVGSVGFDEFALQVGVEDVDEQEYLAD